MEKYSYTRYTIVQRRPLCDSRLLCVKNTSTTYAMLQARRVVGPTAGGSCQLLLGEILLKLLGVIMMKNMGAQRLLVVLLLL